MLSHLVVKISVAGTPEGWIWCLLQGNRLVTAGRVCVYVCVDSRQSHNICFFSINLLYSFSDPLCHLLCPCPPSSLSFLTPLHALIVLPSLLSFQYPPPPSITPSLLTVEGEKGKLSHSFPVRLLLVTPLSIHLVQFWVKQGLVLVEWPSLFFLFFSPVFYSVDINIFYCK